MRYMQYMRYMHLEKNDAGYFWQIYYEALDSAIETTLKRLQQHNRSLDILKACAHYFLLLLYDSP